MMVRYSVKLFFFFSSRRRHTRLQGDWSSDVCSSDLVWSGWDKAAGTSTAGFNTTITLPIAKNADGSSITGPAYEYIDRKSTRLNSSHLVISYAVFCLKKKKKKNSHKINSNNKHSHHH